MKGKQCKSCHYHKPHYMHYPCMSRKPKNIVEELEFTIQDSIFAGFILALIDEYNMGKKRLTRYIEAAYDLIKEVKDGRMSKAEFTAYYYKHCYKEAAA